MKEFIDKLIERLEEIRFNVSCSECPYKSQCDEAQENVDSEQTDLCGETMRVMAIKIVNQLAEEHNNGWIPCDKELPPQPKGNVTFENKPLELYLVSLKNADYPLRALWNGKYFTDGWCKLEVTAWRPLPARYQPKGE